MAKKTAELSYAQFRISMNLTLLESFFYLATLAFFRNCHRQLSLPLLAAPFFRLFFVTRDLYVPAAHLEHIM